MTTPITDGKILVNAIYHSAVVTGLAVGYGKLGKTIIKGPVPKLDFDAYDTGMLILDIGLAMATKDMLVKQGIIPSDILK
jgi:hypothetical protein